MREERFMEYFRQNFIHLRDVPVVLYGVGQYTRVIVEHAADFHIAGLMDVERTGKRVYGHRVLSETEAAEQAKAIIIVANLSSAEQIYRRIAGMVQAAGIAVYYLNGLQPAAFDASVECLPYWEKNEKELRARIGESDVVSFDIFDTLLMRICEKPSDIFVFTAYAMGAADVEGFRTARLAAEKLCYRQISKYFSLEQIYGILQEQGVLAGRAAAEWIAKEIEMEKRFLIPRRAVCEWSEYAREQGKTVLLVSDMYLSAQMIREILTGNGIADYDGLFVSCDVKADKYWGGMWDMIRAAYPEKRILHIGDHPIADRKTPEEHGITAYPIAGAAELMKMCGIGAFLRAEGKAAGDSLILGLFQAKAFQNPLGMRETKGRLYVKDMYDFGYLFYGPMLFHYTWWLIQKARQEQTDVVLFVARDGFLLKQLYEILGTQTGSCIPRGVYFLSSRRAASVAAIEGEEDIRFIFEQLCNIAAEAYADILDKAFGIVIDEDDPYLEASFLTVEKETLCRHTIGRYGRRILENARRERAGYEAYIRTLDLGNGKPGFVNFVCRGVTQRCISQVMKKRIKGFYFAAEDDIDDIYPDPEDIFCLYEGRHSGHTSRLHLVRNMLCGEMILSAPEGGLISFSPEGTPVYAERETDFAELAKCHQGILQFAKDLLALAPDVQMLSFSNALPDFCLGVSTMGHVMLSPQIREFFGGGYEDYYAANRRRDGR